MKFLGIKPRNLSMNDEPAEDERLDAKALGPLLQSNQTARVRYCEPPRSTFFFFHRTLSPGRHLPPHITVQSFRLVKDNSFVNNLFLCNASFCRIRSG